MTTKKTKVPHGIYQIKVTLVGTKPSIWRRLLVSGEMTLAQLHDVLQAAMGWENRHLHEFTIGRKRYGTTDEDTIARPNIDEQEVHLLDVLKPGATARYTYDFGDNWEHSLFVEKVLTPALGALYPACIEGERHGPPEDCGGVGGFYDFLVAIRDPKHDQHEEMMDWIGGIFDQESFSVEAVNQRLQQQFRLARKALPLA